MATKQFYFATISTNVVVKEVQLVKEELEVLEDVERTPKPKSWKT